MKNLFQYIKKIKIFSIFKKKIFFSDIDNLLQNYEKDNELTISQKKEINKSKDIREKNFKI